MKKKTRFWMNLVLVFALVAGLLFPVENVNAASKKKVLVVCFSATGNTKNAAIKKATGGTLYQIKAAAKGAKVVKGKDLTDLSYESVKKWAKKQVKESGQLRSPVTIREYLKRALQSE